MFTRIYSCNATFETGLHSYCSSAEAFLCRREAGRSALNNFTIIISSSNSSSIVFLLESLAGKSTELRELGLRNPIP